MISLDTHLALARTAPRPAHLLQGWLLQVPARSCCTHGSCQTNMWAHLSPNPLASHTCEEITKLPAASGHPTGDAHFCIASADGQDVHSSYFARHVHRSEVSQATNIHQAHSAHRLKILIWQMSRLRPPSPILQRLQWQVCGDCITQAQRQPLALWLPLTIQTLPNAAATSTPSIVAATHNSNLTQCRTRSAASAYAACYCGLQFCGAGIGCAEMMPTSTVSCTRMQLTHDTLTGGLLEPAVGAAAAAVSARALSLLGSA
jgi:hypothetical protein